MFIIDFRCIKVIISRTVSSLTLCFGTKMSRSLVTGLHLLYISSGTEMSRSLVTGLHLFYISSGTEMSRSLVTGLHLLYISSGTEMSRSLVTGLHLLLLALRCTHIACCHTSCNVKVYLLSIRIFFWERMLIFFFSPLTSSCRLSLSLLRLTSSPCSLSHMSCNCAMSCCTDSIDLDRELMVISNGPSSTPWNKLVTVKVHTRADKINFSYPGSITKSSACIHDGPWCVL